MRRTLKVLEGVRDGRGRLGRLLLVGGSELLVFIFCVEDAVDGCGPQPLGAIEVEGGVVPGLVPPDRRPSFCRCRSWLCTCRSWSCWTCNRLSVIVEQ